MEAAGVKSVFLTAVDLADSFYNDKDLVEKAMAGSISLDYAVYDMLYFVLVRRHMATLFTLDKSLQELCLNHGVNCVFLNIEFKTYLIVRIGFLHCRRFTRPIRKVHIVTETRLSSTIKRFIPASLNNASREPT